VLAAGCTGLDAFNPVCQIGNLGGSLAASGFESVLNSISQWVANGAEWLLGQIGQVLVSTTTIDVGATWFRNHYGQMTTLAGVVILPMLLVSTVQAILRLDAGQLVRTFLLRLPLALLLAVVAIQIVIMGLSVTDEMSNAMAGGTGADLTSLLSGVTKGLVAAAADPTIASFVLLLIALLVAVAAFVLWLELLIRAAAVYVAALFLPLALATLVWPAVSHWCRRLVETLAALILSKFVIVATLSLAAGAVASGTAGTGSHGSGLSAVLAGGALLLMATFVPFAILRLIPAVESGAVGHLEGLRQRGTASLSQLSRSAASHVLQEGLGALGDARLLAQAGASVPRAGGAAKSAGATTRSTGTATRSVGSAASTNGRGPHGQASGDDEELLAQVTPENGGLVSGPDGGLAVGNPESQKIYDDAVARGAVPPPKGPPPIRGGSSDGDGRTADGAGNGRRGGDQGAKTPGQASPGQPSPAQPSPAKASPAQESPPRRVPVSRRIPARTGPATPEDAWKWEGVPPGRGLIGPVEPGKMRHYMGDDGHGPCIKWLPAAWPPGQEPEG
jgi:hypothetical protein